MHGFSSEITMCGALAGPETDYSLTTFPHTYASWLLRLIKLLYSSWQFLGDGVLLNPSKVVARVVRYRKQQKGREHPVLNGMPSSRVQISLMLRIVLGPSTLVRMSM